MEIIEVDPHNIKIDRANERWDIDSINDLADNIKENGLDNPPWIRKSKNGNDENYRVYRGQRRVLGSIYAGLDKIEAIYEEKEDKNARISSIRENLDLFKEEVNSLDRLRALIELYGENPNFKKVADDIGVRRRLVSTWYEPTRGDWKNVISIKEKLYKESDGNGFRHTFDISEVGEQTLAEIRRTIESGSDELTIEDEGVKLAKLVEEGELSRADIQRIKNLVKGSKDKILEDNPELYKKVLYVIQDKDIDVDKNALKLLSESIDELKVSEEEKDSESKKDKITKEKKEEKKKDNEKDVEEKLDEKYDMINQERQRRKNNQTAHATIIGVLKDFDDLRCPKCAVGPQNLVWSCCNINIETAMTQVRINASFASESDDFEEMFDKDQPAADLPNV